MTTTQPQGQNVLARRTTIAAGGVILVAATALLTFYGDRLHVTGDLEVTGDVRAAGGYRATQTAVIENITASVTSRTASAYHITAGSVTGLLARLDPTTAITAGSITCAAYVSGAPIGTDPGGGNPAHALTFTSADAVGTIKAETITVTEHPFSAAAYSDVRCVGSADLSPSGSIDMTVALGAED